MTDPFQNVSSASPETIEVIIDGLEARGVDPATDKIVGDYVNALDWPDNGLLVEIGCGTGTVARRLAEHYEKGRVLGIDPSPELIGAARDLAGETGNLTFETGDGASLSLGDGVADIVVLHTVLSHVPDPVVLIREAARILGRGGQMVVCDADFSKLTLGIVDGDPLDACVKFFLANNVTNHWFVSDLRRMASDEHLTVESFTVIPKLDLDGNAGRLWVKMGTNDLLAKGVIGEPLATALMDEYERRVKSGQLYGFSPYATLIARKD